MRYPSLRYHSGAQGQLERAEAETLQVQHTEASDQICDALGLKKHSGLQTHGNLR